MGVLVRVAWRSGFNRMNICCKRGFFFRLAHMIRLSCPKLAVCMLAKLRTQPLPCPGG